MEVRARRLNWDQIQQAHFPSKRSDDCRRRHESLMKRQSPASPKIAGSDDDSYIDPGLLRLLEASAEGEVYTMPTPSPQREIGSPRPETFTGKLSSFVGGADSEADARLDLERW
jgi:hypothetical protein